MGDVKNLSHSDAIKKMQDIGEKIKVCMFCTLPGEFPMETRPMSVQKIDDEGNIWFMSAIDSNKNEEIEEDQHVQLIFSEPGDMTFMTVHGTASVSKDRNKIEELWTPIAKVWMQGGKDDPRLSVIRVSPEEAYYWDNKHNKMVAFLKMVAALATGKTMDDGIEGTMKP